MLRDLDTHYSADDEGLESFVKEIFEAPLCEESDADIIASLDWLDDDWSNKVSKALPQTLSNKVTRRFRRSDARDKETLKKIQEMRAGLPRLSSPSSVVIFNPSSTPSKTVKSADTLPSPSNDNLSLPVWELTSDRVKLTFANNALGEAAVSWSLNLSPDRIDEAQHHPKDFVDSIKRELDRLLKRKGCTLPYWFALDVNGGDRLHLHGAVGAGQEQLSVFREALLDMARIPVDQRGNGWWFDCNPQRCDDDWVKYALRNHGRVRKLITGKPLTITKPLRRTAGELYGKTRALQSILTSLTPNPAACESSAVQIISAGAS